VTRLVLAVIIFLAGTAFAQAPVPVAERVITQKDTATRITLFSNRSVVVTIRENEEQKFLRRITLPDDQYLKPPLPPSFSSFTSARTPRESFAFRPWPRSHCRCRGS
jgi:hypothetical protein